MGDQYSNVPTTRTAKDITTYAHNTDALHVHKVRSSISSTILVRLLSIVFIGALAIWANYEASRDDSHTPMVNNANGSPVGHHFPLFYASNDKVMRIILDASDFDNVKNLSHGGNTNCIWWEEEDPQVVAQWLSYCEGQQNGLFQRLHQAVSDCISEGAVGESATNPCNATIGAILEQSAKIIAG